MATESPLLHDGSQTVAAANYGNGANLAGSNTAGTTGGSTGSGQYLAVSLTSAGRTVAIAGAAAQIYGILQNKPAAGQAADVGIFGVTKAVAGNSITAANPLMTKSDGTVIPWTSGSNKPQIGYAIEGASAGQVFTMFLGPTGNTVT